MVERKGFDHITKCTSAYPSNLEPFCATKSQYTPHIEGGFRHVCYKCTLLELIMLLHVISTYLEHVLYIHVPNQTNSNNTIG